MLDLLSQAVPVGARSPGSNERRTCRVAASSMLLLFAACKTSAAPRRAEFLAATPGAMQSLPFSEAVSANGFLFVSGQIGNLPGKLELPPGGIAVEAKQALENMQAVLQRHGASLRDVVKVTTRRGDITVPALVVTSIRPDTVFIPYHWPGRKAANQLTNRALDPISKIPEYKVCACKVEKVSDTPVSPKGRGAWQPIAFKK